MGQIEKYLQDDLFIVIDLHYKREKYYRWGEVDKEEKFFTYKIVDMVNTTYKLIKEENNHYEFYFDEFKNENKYETYADALNAAVKQCDEYLSFVKSNLS